MAETSLHVAGDILREIRDSGTLPSLAAKVNEELEEARARASAGDLLALPTEAELSVLRLLASDLSAPEIGERLFLSVNTIRSHTRSLYRKLGVNSRAEAVARAAALGIQEEPESSR